LVPYGDWGKSNMRKSEEYRRRAVACLRLVESMTEPASKMSLLDMARAWHRLAIQADRSSKFGLVCESVQRDRG
jgi:hypothetical protein